MLSRWRAFRDAYLAQHGLCASCRRRRGELKIATALRYVVVVTDPAMLFDARLCEPACGPCAGGK